MNGVCPSLRLQVEHTTSLMPLKFLVLPVGDPKWKGISIVVEHPFDTQAN